MPSCPVSNPSARLYGSMGDKVEDRAEMTPVIIELTVIQAWQTLTEKLELWWVLLREVKEPQEFIIEDINVFSEASKGSL